MERNSHAGRPVADQITAVVAMTKLWSYMLRNHEVLGFGFNNNNDLIVELGTTPFPDTYDYVSITGLFVIGLGVPCVRFAAHSEPMIDG